MELTPSQKKTVRHQFDSFCRKVLREEARDYFRHLNVLSQHEQSLSWLSDEQLSELCVLDEYPSESYRFHVQEFNVCVSNEDLAQALASITDEKQSIVVLAYFLDMTDENISGRSNIVRQTVQYKFSLKSYAS